jgi:hypothetical protein
MTLPRNEAKLRAEALKRLGRAIAHTDRAMRHCMYNRRTKARDAIGSAELALQQADDALFNWQRKVKA